MVVIIPSFRFFAKKNFLFTLHFIRNVLLIRRSSHLGAQCYPNDHPDTHSTTATTGTRGAMGPGHVPSESCMMQKSRNKSRRPHWRWTTI